jgi:murein DD-endopeptidase MepM/ murein hydrolase activator NlpD
MNFPVKFQIIVFAALLAISGLTGCRARDLSPEPNSVILPAPGTPAENQAPEESPTVPVEFAADNPDPVQIAPASDPGEPARFIFPTPVPPPQSAWRPPLYPVPWALRDYDHFFFTRPIPVDDINWPLANYRYGGIFFEDVVHTGVDIPNRIGTPVLAAGPGKVIWSGYGLLNFVKDNMDDPYGLAIAIKHDFGYEGQPLYTLYAHLSESFVIENQRVEAGEQIGLTGNTGATTGPHLHFEVRVGQNDYFSSRNPELWLSPPQGWGILAGSVAHTGGELLTRKEVVVTSLDTFQVWLVMTYGPNNVNPDPYYQENVVMGDLPAGSYRLDINYIDEQYSQDIDIVPGTVTYFTFRGEDGFSLNQPPTPTVDPNLAAP